MAEILVKAADATHADTTVDQRGCYKRGMPVVVQPDGHPWGAREGLPRFYIIKLPGVSVSKVLKYIIEDSTRDDDGKVVRSRRRVWKFAIASMPAAARNKLVNTGVLTIGATGDYTWAQVRAYLINQKTGLAETEAL